MGKGFAWWPAQVLVCSNNSTNTDNNNNTQTTVTTTTASPEKLNYVLVEFFGSDEIATLKNTEGKIRPFDQGKIDSTKKKHKKKINKISVDVGMEEQHITNFTKNLLFVKKSRKGFGILNFVGGGLLGRRIRFWYSNSHSHSSRHSSSSSSSSPNNGRKTKSNNKMMG